MASVIRLNCLVLQSTKNGPTHCMTSRDKVMLPDRYDNDLLYKISNNK